LGATQVISDRYLFLLNKIMLYDSAETFIVDDDDADNFEFLL